MKPLFERLSRVCAEYPLRKKVLVMPSISAGSALMQSYGLAGHPSMNVHIHTVPGMALDQTAARLRRQGLRPLPDLLAARLVQEIMLELLNNHTLCYFHTLQVSPGIARAVWNALQELKEAGYQPDHITEDKFVNPLKARDIRRIFSSYQAKLLDTGFIDRPGLLQLALQEPGRPSPPGEIILIPANLEVTSLEREFLSRLIKDHPWASLPLGDVKGLKAPMRYFFEHLPADRPAPNPQPGLGDIYDPTPLPAETRPEVAFFHAYGQSAEVREVFRQIRRETIKLEDAVIYYTSREPYARLFFEEARRCGVPVTFGEGTEVGCFRPGAFIFALLEWIKTDFFIPVLYRLVESSAFRVDLSREPHKTALARDLRGSSIVRGRTRYQKWLDAQPHNAGLKGLKGLLEELLGCIPEPDGEGLVHPGELASGLQGIMQKRCRLAGEGDARAYSAISETLALVSQTPADKTTMEDALEWLESLIASLRVAPSLPEPGSLHVDSYRKGIWTSRNRVFIVGLDARTFPGQAKEDPVLLDVEREALSHKLKKYRFEPAEKIYHMVQLLAARSSGSSRITLSFSSFDTVENREASPSPLLLQVYRKITGETTADYSTLMEKLGPRKGFFPPQSSDSLDQVEWWLANLIDKKREKPLQERVLKRYPHLQEGLTARLQRQSDQFTPYDGNLMPPEPLWKDGRFLSPSALEQLGSCPYGYFLKHVLQISPPDEAAYDPEKWLDAMTRGLLLHEIFEAFYRKLLEKGEGPSYSSHLDLLESIARDRIQRKKDEHPPPHPVIFEYECREILQSCRLFLRCEEDHTGYSRPVYLELAFGLKRDQNPGIPGDISPVRVDLPSGRYLQLRGKIDRVDRLTADDSYMVLDYKTGSTYVYSPGGRFNGGRQLQHALYGLALEEVLRDKGICDAPRIKACGYLFPTLKGEGQRLLRPYRECRERVLEILDCMAEIIDSGAFIMTTEPDKDCTYCDYPAICEMGTFGEAVKEKVLKGQTPALKGFAGIRQLS